MRPVRLDGSHLSVFDVVHVARDHAAVEIDDQVWERVAASRNRVDEVIAQGGVAYGVTTGVGSQKAEGIPNIEAFNRRLLVAHASIASERSLPEKSIRAAMLCLLNGFAQGRSGVRPKLLRALHEALARNEIPTASAGASVGASDLVPLAQIALGVLGVGDPLRGSFDANRGLGLEAKEGLALMSSNAVSLGRGCLLLLAARKLLRGFDLALALTLEGFRGNLSIVHPEVRHAHPEPGQETSSRHLLRLLAKSALLQEGAARNLQDPLSFRCAPQVHGAAYSSLAWLWQNWERELNAVVDNPVVAEGGLISHGNMDTSLLTAGTDMLRSLLGNVASVSAQRQHKLHWPAFSGLPSGLNQEPSALGGVQFLNLGHIAEAYASSVRARCHPTMFAYQGQLADGVEDHATMLPLSIGETDAMIDQAWVVQAIELAVAAWSIRRRGIDVSELGEGLREVYERVEAHLPVGREGIEVFDLRPIVSMVRDEELVDLIDDVAPPVP